MRDLLKDLKDHLINRREDAVLKLEAFADRLKKLDAPSQAFEWSKGEFEAAARYDVAVQLLGSIQRGQRDIEKMYEFAVTEVLKSAQHPPASSSATMNLMQTCTLAEWAKIADELKGWVFLVNEKVAKEKEQKK